MSGTPVALITGGASGIGRAVAYRCANAEMTIVLADIHEEQLAVTTKELSEKFRYIKVISLPVDVSSAESMEKLAQEAYRLLGRVDYLFLNAGVLGGKASTYLSSLKDWEWTINVNLYGVVHGLREFVPRMLHHEQRLLKAQADYDFRIIITASLAGIVSGALFPSPYVVSKVAVVALAEGLHQELAVVGSSIRAHVVCPGMVATGLLDDIHIKRPKEHTEYKSQFEQEKQDQKFDIVRPALVNSTSPEEVVDCIFNAFKSNTFYILPHFEKAKAGVAEHHYDIVDRKNPTNFRIREDLQPHSSIKRYVSLDEKEMKNSKRSKSVSLSKNLHPVN